MTLCGMFIDLTKYDLLVAMDVLNYRANIATGKSGVEEESNTLINKLKERKGIS